MSVETCYFKCSWCNLLSKDLESAISFLVKDIEFKKWYICGECKVEVLSLLKMKSPYDLPCFARKLEDEEEVYKVYSSFNELEQKFKTLDPLFYSFGLILEKPKKIWLQILEEGNLFRQSEKQLTEIEDFILQKSQDDHELCDTNPCGMVRVGWKNFVNEKNLPAEVALMLCPKDVKRQGDLASHIKEFAYKHKLEKSSFLVTSDYSIQDFPNLQDLQFFCFPQRCEKLIFCQTIEELRELYFSPSLIPNKIQEFLPTCYFIKAILSKYELKINKIESLKKEVLYLQELERKISEKPQEPVFMS